MAEKRLYEVLRCPRGASDWRHNRYVRGREKAEQTAKNLDGKTRVREAFLAKAKNIRMSPQKVRLVVDLIRHQNVQKALYTLRTIKKRAPHEVWKVLHSAISNAEQKVEHLDVDRLYVSHAYVNEGIHLPPRFRAVSRGRAHLYKHRQCNIVVAVAEREKG